MILLDFFLNSLRSTHHENEDYAGGRPGGGDLHCVGRRDVPVRAVVRFPRQRGEHESPPVGPRREGRAHPRGERTLRQRQGTCQVPRDEPHRPGELSHARGGGAPCRAPRALRNQLRAPPLLRRHVPQGQRHAHGAKGHHGPQRGDAAQVRPRAARTPRLPDSGVQEARHLREHQSPRRTPSRRGGRHTVPVKRQEQGPQPVLSAAHRVAEGVREGAALARESLHRHELPRRPGRRSCRNEQRRVPLAALLEGRT